MQEAKTVILLDWNSYGNKHIEKSFTQSGFRVKKVAYDGKLHGEAAKKQELQLKQALLDFSPSFVFGFNYIPAVSAICQEYWEAHSQFRYISWIYDSPFLDVYSYTVVNPVNCIYHFDKAVVEEFVGGGISTVHHMPLGYGGAVDAVSVQAYSADISFVGSLYSEPKHRLYERFSGMPAYEKGYLDGLIQAQKHIYGAFILDKMLTDSVLREMEKCYPTDPNPTTAMTPVQMYADFVLARQVTACERKDILELVGKTFGESRGFLNLPCQAADSKREVSDSKSEFFDSKSEASDQKSGVDDSKSGATDSADKEIRCRLYTNDKNAGFPGWENCGPVDYYTQMPEVFRCSKINLNITLRSIKTGIPLRALDIMGSGGFLLTNYQPELFEYFVPGEDFDYYTDYEDLVEKVAFYLEHDELREQIAASGCRKVLAEHSIQKRLEQMGILNL